MKSFDGYLKLKLGNDYVLLAGGSHKALSDFSMSGHSHDNIYLKLTGGRLFNDTRSILQLRDTNTSDADSRGPYILFETGSTNYMTFGYNNTVAAFWEVYASDSNWDKLWIKDHTFTFNGQPILHSGNYTSYLGYIGTTGVLASSANQSLTGIINITATNFRLGLNSVGSRSVLLLNSPANNPADIVFRSGEYTNSTWGDWAISSRGNESTAEQSNSFMISKGAYNDGATGEKTVFKIDHNCNVIIGNLIFSTKPLYRLDVRGIIGTDSKFYNSRTALGTILEAGWGADALGFNSSYGTYIGGQYPDNGGTYYIYSGNANHTCPSTYINGTRHDLLHTGNYTSYLGYIGTTTVLASSAVLNLTGIGTLNGAEAIFTNTSRTFFDLKQTADNTNQLGPYIRFFLNNSEKARTGWNDTAGMFWEHFYSNSLYALVALGPSLTYAGNILLRSDNYTNYVYSKSTSDSRYIPEPTRDSGTLASTYSFRTYHTSTETGINFRRGTSEKFWVGTYDDNGYLCNGSSYFRMYSNRITWSKPLVLSSDGAAASGKLLVSSSYSNGTGLVRLENTNTGNYLWGINFTTPNLTANQTNFALLFGKANSTNNLFDIGFRYVDNGSSLNTMTMGFYNNDFLTYLKANGNFGIGVDPSYRLHTYGVSTSFDVPIQVISNGSSGSWLATSAFLTPNMVAGNYNGIEIGRSMNLGNVGHISFYYAGADSADNRMAIGFFNYVDLLVVKRNGNVGIGTASPSWKLQVNGDARINGIALGNNFSIANRASIRLDPYSTAYPADIIFGTGTYSSGWNNAYWVISSRSASENKVFGIWRATANDGGSELPGLIIHPNLNVKIGEVNGSFATDRGYKLWINGNCAASNFYTTSDARKKQNIHKISDNIKQFEWKESGETSYGFVAQDLEVKHPELVNDDGNMKTVNYNAALSLVVAKLENRVKELEAKLGLETPPLYLTRAKIVRLPSFAVSKTVERRAA